MKYQSALLKNLAARGYIQDCTDHDGLDALLTAEKNVPIYIGFDATAASLHVGSLIQIMILKHIQDAGHKPIVLMGGGTTKVGDPSGKDESRQLLDDAKIQSNIAGIKNVFAQYLHFENSFNKVTNHAFMVNNAEWLEKLNYIDFLRDVGRHFSINRMLTMESVKRRVEREQELTFLEFNYMILQAYDFVELQKHYGCRVQIGGSDQWGNIVMGTDLNRRLGALNTCASPSLYGLTTPLLTTSSGAKMGKTASGAVWLDAAMLSPYDYWQFWRNTEDADVIRFLKLFTLLPLDRIDELSTYEGAKINEVKIILANEATALLHGKDAAAEAADTAHKVFAEGGTGGALPEITIEASRMQEGIPFYKLLHEAGLAKSGGEARRLIQGGGARVNDEAIKEPEAKIDSTLAKDGVIKLSAGKKHHALVKIV